MVLVTLLAVTGMTAATVAAAPPGTPAQVTEGDETEPNDDFGNATNVTSGTYSDLRIDAGDLDIYAVDLAAGESLSAAINFSHAEGDLELAVVDSTRNRVVSQSQSATDGEQVSYVAPQAGTYYVVVYGFQNASAAYEMTLATTAGQPAADGAAGDGVVENMTGDNQTADNQTAVNQTAEQEPNDDFGNATNVTSGTYENRSIDEGDLDFYAVNLTAGDSLSATINFSHAEGDLDMALVDPAQETVVAVSESVTDSENVSHVASQDGTYYLIVYGFDNATAAYNMSLSTTASGNGTATAPPESNLTADEFEPNDDFANATNVSPGAYGNLSIHGPSDLDFYAVNLTAGDALSAAVNFSHAEGDLDVALIGPEGEFLAESVSVTDDENLSHVATRDGPHYLIVYGFDNATAAYNMSLSTTASGGGNATAPPESDLAADEFEPNNDFGNATNASPGTYGNLSVTEGDMDFYAIQAERGSVVEAAINFSHAEGDLDMVLVEPSQEFVVAGSASVTDDENLSHVAPESGTYYLVVFGFDNATNEYGLTVGPDGAAENATGPPTNETGESNGSGVTNETDEPAAVGGEAPADPDEDVIGWENGYWANESIDVDQTDGLNEDELDAYLARSMARVEEIRQFEFEREVAVTVESRAALANSTRTDTFERLVSTGYYNQLFEALFIVDEETDAYEEFVGEFSATTGGYYAVGQDQIVIIAENESAPVIDEGLLAHELTHALQDQNLDLIPGFVNATTVDESLGWQGLMEGDANYVEYEYLDRCDQDWQCVETPQQFGEPAEEAEFNVGIYLGGYNPYSDGPALVSELRNRSGGDWSAVNDAYEDPPASAEQVIHPERYPDEDPAAPAEPSLGSGDWQLFGVERLGESWLYSMFFYQGYQYNNSVIQWETINEPEGGPYDTYNYTSAPSEGWAGDQLLMYTDGEEYAYTWTLTWDSEEDATEFREAYEQVLQGQGAEQRGETTWVIPESEPYADAFHVSQDGDTVTVVNAPDEASLSEVAPDVVGQAANATATNGTVSNATS